MLLRWASAHLLNFAFEDAFTCPFNLGVISDLKDAALMTLALQCMGKDDLRGACRGRADIPSNQIAITSGGAKQHATKKSLIAKLVESLLACPLVVAIPQIAKNICGGA